MKSLRNFLIYVNSIKDSDRTLSNQLVEIIKRHNGTATIASGDQDTVQGCVTEDKLKDRDAIIVLGGDGTFLRAAHVTGGYDLPMIGVNLGRMGFLAEVEVQRMEEMVQHLVEGNYKLSERMLLTGKIGDGSFKAVNDIVFYRTGKLRLIALKVYVNGDYFETYKADGVIISTPTGSTAYNLSAGGPLVSPDAKVMIVTPISPHSLESKSFVFSSEDKIRVEVLEDCAYDGVGVDVSFDGFINRAIKEDEYCDIEVLGDTVKCLSITESNFYDILRQKIKRID